MNFHRLVGALTLAAFALAGCAGTGARSVFSSEDPALLSPEERQIRDVERSRIAQATAIGCAAGLGTGLIIANQTSQNQTAITVLSTLAGCVTGFAAGAYLNERTQAVASDQRGYRQLIAAADEDIARYRSLNETSRRLVAQQERKVADLNRQYRQSAITKEDYRAQIASAEGNLDTLSNQVKALDEQIRVMRKDSDQLRAAGADTKELNSRISKLETEKRDLEKNVRELSSIYNDVPEDVKKVTL